MQALTYQVREQLPPHHQILVRQNVARDYGTLFANQGGDEHGEIQVHVTQPLATRTVGNGGPVRA